MPTASSGESTLSQPKLMSDLRALRVSVILPTLNESENIVPLIDEIRQAVPSLHEVIVVDDDSPDGTAALVEAYGRRLPEGLVKIERRLSDHGLTKSLWHGISVSSGDVVVWMDCDFSMPPAVIPQLLKCIDEGYHIAVGSRFVRGGSFKQNTKGTQDSWLAVLLSRMMNYAVQFALDHSFKDYTSGFAAVRKSVFKEVAFRGDYGEYFIDFIYRALRRGYTVIEIPYVCVPRKAGESKTGQNIIQYVRRGIGYLKTAARLRWESLTQPKFPERVPNLTSEEMDPAQPVQIRAMRQEHIPMVAGLHHQVLRQTLNSRLGIPFLEALYGTIIEDEDASAWVALYQNRIVGFLTASRNLHATDARLAGRIPLREKLSAGLRIFSNLSDIRDLIRHKALTAFVRWRWGRPYPTILTVGVSPLAQGKGVARQLIEESDAYFVTQKVPRYFVDTLTDNGRARRFYERMGFEYLDKCLGNAIYQRRLASSDAKPV